MSHLKTSKVAPKDMKTPLLPDSSGPEGPVYMQPAITMVDLSPGSTSTQPDTSNPRLSLPRLIPRRGEFHQARGAFRIKRRIPSSALVRITNVASVLLLTSALQPQKLVRSDLYHQLVELPTWQLIFWLRYKTILLVLSLRRFVASSRCLLLRDFRFPLSHIPNHSPKPALYLIPNPCH